MRRPYWGYRRYRVANWLLKKMGIKSSFSVWTGRFNNHGGCQCDDCV